MHLHKIKMAGFKSFVDPTTLHLPSSLVGIVGPNGCGKSNTIDAVRWVMGESSAKHLRGESMDDVIFNGSNARKPVGKAFVELIFDNTDGRAGGEYAKYSEIAIRREVSREGQSQYYLNGTRCRRRDITDLFLGTGLGPRSYAIIEQGMITRLIDAKPLEMRAFLEEAAGISRYKERRRETENRMRHTRENLDRLNDLRDEIIKQLTHLERQSKAAEKYKVFKQDERQLIAQLLELKLRDMDGQLESRQSGINEKQTALEKVMAQIRHAETQIETFREQRTESNEAFNAVQAAFYQIGGEINSLEQQIQHQRELHQRREAEKTEAEQALSQAKSDIERDESALLGLREEMVALEPEVQSGSEALEQSRQQLTVAEQGMTDWQASWDDFNRRVAAPAQQAQVEKTKMEQLEQRISQQASRIKRLDDERNAIQTDSLQAEITQMASSITVQKTDQDQSAAALTTTQNDLGQLRETIKTTADQLNSLQQKSQQSRGRLASLEALQQAALGKDKNQLRGWLEKFGLQKAARLGEKIIADPDWSSATEMVLGEYLEAVEVDSLSNHQQHLPELQQGNVVLFEGGQGEHGNVTGTLGSKVKAPASIQGLLSQIRLADDLDQALKMRGELAEHESIVTADGYWLGKSWLRLSQQSGDHGGMLARKEDITSLQTELAKIDQESSQLKQQLELERNKLTKLENQRDEQQNIANQAHREFSNLNSRLDQFRSRLDQFKQRSSQLSDESTELNSQIEQFREAHQQATELRNAAVTQAETLQQERQGIESERETHRKAVTDARQALENLRNATHQKQLKLESLKTAQRSTTQNLERMQQQLTRLSDKLVTLDQSMEEGDSPVEALAQQLATLLTQRVSREQSLSSARDSLQSLENQVREQEKQRQAAEAQHNEQREALESLRLNAQELMVRARTQEERLAEMELTREEVAKGLQASETTPTITQWEADLEAMERRIQRLGAINLAAIDEFQEQSERKTYLDSQFDDLNEALDTLEAAMSKIDKETRQRFKETFDLVNESFQKKFPKLFGGGHALLEMTEEDLLTTGVNIMARPPGKRVSNIQLLSGGEKALTAVALVFSIFELNPAPFCMLDEVDAPLDDANVGRFCDLVAEMSEDVQFIFITHNKITMELARQLIGVTMREPGVSRMVDVDIDAAAEMVG